MENDSQYDELWQQFHEVPGDRGQLAILEQIISLADSNKDVETGFDARQLLVTQANSAGYPEKAIVAFSWCIAQMDKDEKLHNWYDMLWQYKVIQELIPVFSSVSRQQIINMQEDFSARLLKNGYTERTAHYYRSWNFMRMGDYQLAYEHQNRYLSMRSDGMADCKACEKDREIELLSRMKLDDEALKQAEPIRAGKMSCAEVPGFTNGHIGKSLLRLGKVEEAQKLFPMAMDYALRERKYLGTIGDLLLIPIRSGEIDQAFNFASKYFAWASEAAAEELRFRFFSACELLFESLAKDRKDILMRVPKEFDFHSEQGRYEIESVREWFKQQSLDLARKFNDRNGNDRYHEMLSDNRALAGMC